VTTAYDHARTPAGGEEHHMLSDGRSHTPAYCPGCRALRTFNPDRCVVCGHPALDAQVIQLRRDGIDAQLVSRNAGRRHR
jgi:hypothetical protein